MKTNLMMLAFAGMLLATVAPTAQALDTSPAVKIAVDGTNHCNGIIENNCTCRAGVWYCQEGDKCARYVWGICVEGGSAASAETEAPVAETVGVVEVPQVEAEPTSDSS